MHLHAATTVDGRDRKQLERVCRYMLRPPFAHDAVLALLDGRVRVHFKAAWRSGAAHADMSADKFIARLCALVPPPGFHMTRYHGVFANRHHLRPRIIPPSPVPTPGQQLALGLADSASGKPDDTESSPRPRRLGWAKPHPHRPAGYSARQQNSRLKLLNRSNPKPVPDDGPIIAYRQWCERFWPPDYLADGPALGEPVRSLQA